MLFLPVLVLAQQQTIPANEQYRGLQNAALSRELVLRAYEKQDPVFLITAALNLAEFPVAGTLQADSLVLENAVPDPSRAGAKIISLIPDSLLNDAKRMAAGDSLLGVIIDRTREKVHVLESQPRGRKFSPLIREFELGSKGCVKIWSTFNANEVAEIFVSGNGTSALSLYLYDPAGNLVASDLKNIDDCYLSFTPSATLQYRIEIRNNGTAGNKCLLMTN